MDEADDDMKAFLQKHGKKPATYQVVHDLTDMLMAKWGEMNERNKERNTKIEALENRVLELEAAAAAKVSA